MLLVMMVLSLPVYGQGQRVTVGVVPFTHSRMVLPSHAQTIFIDVQSKLAESGRVNVVEIEQLDAVEQEVDAQGAETYIGGNIVDLAPEGAEYLLVGTVSAANALLRADSLGYDSIVSYELRLVSVSTREVACSDVIKKANSVKDVAQRGLTSLMRSRGGDESAEVTKDVLGRGSQEDAIQKALKEASKQADAFINKCFPLELEILSVEVTGKKGNVEQVLISGGDEWGLQVKDHLTVVEPKVFTMPNGETRNRAIPVATLEVIEVQGEGFSLCKVLKGGMKERLTGKKAIKNGQKKLADALEAGKTLIVSSRPQGN